MTSDKKSTWFLFILFLFLPMITNAAVTTWEIIPGESQISFIGTQNNSPASGSFKKFSGTIHFDPSQLNDSKVRITIDINSVTTSYSDFTSTLLTEDWFNVKLFPEAVFETTHFTKLGDNKYQANGTLTIRDKTIPVVLTFEAKELSSAKALVKGSTVLQRTKFGVGQGEWADTDTVKDNVQVNFSITAIKK